MMTGDENPYYVRGMASALIALWVVMLLLFAVISAAIYKERKRFDRQCSSLSGEVLEKSWDRFCVRDGKIMF